MERSAGISSGRFRPKALSVRQGRCSLIDVESETDLTGACYQMVKLGIQYIEPRQHVLMTQIGSDGGVPQKTGPNEPFRRDIL